MNGDVKSYGVSKSPLLPHIQNCDVDGACGVDGDGDRGDVKSYGFSTSPPPHVRIVMLTVLVVSMVMMMMAPLRSLNSTTSLVLDILLILPLIRLGLIILFISSQSPHLIAWFCFLL